MRTLALLPLLLFPVASHAATIPGLFDTGLDLNGSPLADGATDPHYALGGPYTPAVAIQTDPAWVTPPSGSRWIAPDATTNLGGTYAYTITFSLANLDPSTASVSGMWSSDNGGTISLNGMDTAFDTGSSSATSFETLHSFLIDDGFGPGTNTLTFTVRNNDGPTGLLVSSLAGTAAVPEPSSSLLVAALALFLILTRTLARGLAAPADPTTCPHRGNHATCQRPSCSNPPCL